LSFRPNIKEDTFSTTYLVNDALKSGGYNVQVHDTEFSAVELEKKGFQAAADIYEAHSEAVFLVTMHKQYASIDFDKLAQSGVKVVVDGRNQLAKSKVEAAGIRYIGIGR
jgi:UDP-N-acetyl-D-mannosaminuronate dehydrogenase